MYKYWLKREIITKNRTSVIYSHDIKCFDDLSDAIELYDFIKNDFGYYCVSKGEFLSTYIEMFPVYYNDDGGLDYDFENSSILYYHEIKK